MPTLDPRSPEFWQLENALLWEAVSPLTMRALLAGAETAASMLPAEVQALVSWDHFNQAAISYLQEYRLSTISNITDTTRRQAISAIDGWIREGAPLSTLQDRLAPIFGQPRADSIAVTEVTRVFAKGNKALWKSTGLVSSEQWMTAKDEDVCPICRPLQGNITKLDDQFRFDMAEMAQSDAMRNLLGNKYTVDAALAKAGQLVNSLGAGVTEPPAHVRCRCWTQPILSEVAFERQLEEILT